MKIILLLLTSFFLLSFQKGDSQQEKAMKIIYKADKKLRKVRQKGKFFGKRRKRLIKRSMRRYRKAHTKDPRNSTIGLALAKMLLANKKYQEAVNVLDRVSLDFLDHLSQGEQEAWRGIVNAHVGNFNRTLQHTKKAFRMYRQQDTIKYTTLATLINNIGVGFLLTKSVCGMPSDMFQKEMEDTLKQQTGREKPHLTIDSCELHFAKHFFRRALFFNAQDSNARKNLDYLESLIDTVQQECPKYKKAYNQILSYLPNAQQQVAVGDLTITSNLVNVTDETINIKIDNAFLLDHVTDIIKESNKYKEVVMILDHSGSMGLDAGIRDRGYSRFDMLTNSVKYALTKIKRKVNVGMVSVGRSCQVIPAIDIQVAENNRTQLLSAVDALEINGGTPLIENLQYATKLFSKDKEKKKAIILFSDGLDGCDYNVDYCRLSQWFKVLGIDVYIVSFLLDKGSNLDEYASYSCLATKKIYGITRDGSLESKEMTIKNEIYSVIIPQHINQSNCMQALARFSINVADLKEQNLALELNY